MEPIPDYIRVLNVFGAEYYIPWEELTIGSSFFLPTTAVASQVKKSLRPAERYFDWVLEVRQRCEFGRFGVRVWRTY